MDGMGCHRRIGNYRRRGLESSRPHPEVRTTNEYIPHRALAPLWHNEKRLTKVGGAESVQNGPAMSELVNPWGLPGSDLPIVVYLTRMPQ